MLLYLTECTLFRIHYIGKSETQFKVRLRNHRKYVNRQNSPLLDWHFKQIGHNFKQQAKFTLIEQLDNIIVEFFLTIWVFFHLTLTDYRNAEEGGVNCNSSMLLPPASRTLRPLPDNNCNLTTKWFQWWTKFS